jgi:putative membrane protein
LKVLGAGAQATVTETIRAAETKTLGEIVPVVLERSDDHAAARWRCALFGLLVGSALLERFLPWTMPERLLASQLALGILGYCLARLLPDLERIFVSESLATETAEEQAVQEFHRYGLRETKSRTGVLIFVSLFERRVVVLGDEGIHLKAGDDLWKRTRDAISTASRGTGSPRASPPAFARAARCSPSTIRRTERMRTRSRTD